MTKRRLISISSPSTEFTRIVATIHQVCVPAAHLGTIARASASLLLLLLCSLFIILLSLCALMLWLGAALSEAAQMQQPPLAFP